MLLKEEISNNLEVCDFDSSDIHKTIYNQELSNLIIFFRRGGTYSYTNVDYITYLEFKESESQGKYFQQKIRKNPNVITEKLS